MSPNPATVRVAAAAPEVAVIVRLLPATLYAAEVMLTYSTTRTVLLEGVKPGSALVTATVIDVAVPGKLW